MLTSVPANGTYAFFIERSYVLSFFLHIFMGLFIDLNMFAFKSACPAFMCGFIETLMCAVDTADFASSCLLVKCSYIIAFFGLIILIILRIDLTVGTFEFADLTHSALRPFWMFADIITVRLIGTASCLFVKLMSAFMIFCFDHRLIASPAHNRTGVGCKA